MAEIELAALSKICLDRRLDSIEKMNTEILQTVKECQDNKVLIKWQFTSHKARIRLNRHYNKVNTLNEIIQK